jgi:hypothetical protein
MADPAVQEFEAIKAVHDALAPLNEEGRTRVLTYIASLLGINAKVGNRAAASADDEGEDGDSSKDDGKGAGGTPKEPKTFSSFAELYAAADPKTNGEKALVVGYWLQVCQAADNFTAAAANKELTHLGHKVANITDAIDSVKDQKPMLILQLKKSGNSRQARKLYKVSHEGAKRVEEMLRG